MTIRSDMVVLPPTTEVKRLRSVHSATSGAATSSPIFTYPTVALVSSTDATPIVITVGAGHGFLAGDKLVVAGHTTNVGANGTWVAGTVGATTIVLTGSVGSGAGAGGATGTVNFSPDFIIPANKHWVTFTAITVGVYVRFGLAASAATTALNGLFIPPSTSVSLYLTPSQHVNVDHFATGGAAGVLLWYVSSMPGEREQF